MISDFKDMEERYDFKIRHFNEMCEKIDAEVKSNDKKQHLINESL